MSVYFRGNKLETKATPSSIQNYANNYDNLHAVFVSFHRNDHVKFITTDYSMALFFIFSHGVRLQCNYCSYMKEIMHFQKGAYDIVIFWYE